MYVHVYTGCADGFFKSGTGNAMCEECLTNQVSIADRTNCVCVANHIGDNCDRKCSGACTVRTITGLKGSLQCICMYVCNVHVGTCTCTCMVDLTVYMYMCTCTCIHAPVYIHVSALYITHVVVSKYVYTCTCKCAKMCDTCITYMYMYICCIYHVVSGSISPSLPPSLPHRMYYELLHAWWSVCGVSSWQCKGY